MVEKTLWVEWLKLLQQKLEGRFRNMSGKDGLWASTIKWFYGAFTSTGAQMVVGTVCTVILTVLSGRQIFDWRFKVFVAFYLVGVVMCAWVARYNRNKSGNLKWFQESIEHLVITARSSSVIISDLRMDRKGVADWNFVKAADIVCSEICAMLRDIRPQGKVYVNVLERVRSDRVENYKMIACYENRVRISPARHKTVYPTNASRFFSEIFQNSSEDIWVLASKEEVERTFQFDEESSERSRKICQYIGIPIFAVNKTSAGNERSRVMFLLQIDVDTPNYFGVDANAVEETARNILSVYANYLRICYEMNGYIEKIKEADTHAHCRDEEQPF